MKKNAPASPEKSPAPWLPPRARVSTTLVVLAFTAALLSLFQWMELLVLHAGGKSICALSTQVNCEAVWRLPMAKWIHASLGVPVAGMGLVWALAAFVAALRLLAVRDEVRTGTAIAAVRITGVLGFAASIALAAVSMAAGVVCPTCLVTYALTLLFGAFAIFGLPKPIWPRRPELLGGVGWSLLPAVIAYGLLFMPGRATPRTGELDLPKPPALAAAGTRPNGGAQLSAQEEAIARYITTLSPNQQKSVAESLAILRASPKVDLKAYPARTLEGPPNAPVHIVEWTDILCVHCAELTNTMKWLHDTAPPGSFSLEARHFPLDSACNPEMKQGSDGNIRCDGARAQVCLESAPDFWVLRKKLFDAQGSLSREKILQLATSTGTVARAALDACMKDPATDVKIKADVAYGMKYNPEGTPIVTINGRAGTPTPAFLFSIVGAKGDPESPAFAKVPRVPVPSHEGHQH